MQFLELDCVSSGGTWCHSQLAKQGAVIPILPAPESHRFNTNNTTQRRGEGDEILQNKFSWQKYLSFHLKFKNNEAGDFQHDGFQLFLLCFLHSAMQTLHVTLLEVYKQSGWYCCCHLSISIPHLPEWAKWKPRILHVTIKGPVNPSEDIYQAASSAGIIILHSATP